MVRIDYVSREVTVGGRLVQLTPLEFKLLSTFVRHPNETLGRERLLELVWGDTEGFGGDQVKLYVGYLRRKLGWDATASPIETVRGLRLPLPSAGRVARRRRTSAWRAGRAQRQQRP